MFPDYLAHRARQLARDSFSLAARLTGVLQGLGVGLIGAVALPLVGVASGCMQMARGVYNTPEALGHVMAADAVWDEATGRWSNMSIQVPSPRVCVCAPSRGGAHVTRQQC